MRGDRAAPTLGETHPPHPQAILPPTHPPHPSTHPPTHPHPPAECAGTPPPALAPAAGAHPPWRRPRPAPQQGRPEPPPADVRACVCVCWGRGCEWGDGDEHVRARMCVFVCVGGGGESGGIEMSMCGRACVWRVHAQARPNMGASKGRKEEMRQRRGAHLLALHLQAGDFCRLLLGARAPDDQLTLLAAHLARQARHLLARLDQRGALWVGGGGVGEGGRVQGDTCVGGGGGGAEGRDCAKHEATRTHLLVRLALHLLCLALQLHSLLAQRRRLPALALRLALAHPQAASEGGGVCEGRGRTLTRVQRCVACAGRQVACGPALPPRALSRPPTCAPRPRAVPAAP